MFGKQISRICWGFGAAVIVVQLMMIRTDVLAASSNGISDPAYQLLTERVAANRKNFYVYKDADSGFNHGFASGSFGAISKIHLDAACVDDPGASNGCSGDLNALDRTRGTVLRISFDPLIAGEYAGINIQEPAALSGSPTEVGYDLTGAERVVFDVRSPDEAEVQFSVAGRVGPWYKLRREWSTIRLELTTPGLTKNDLKNVKILFVIVTNDKHAPAGATVLLDNIHFEPVPAKQQTALGFPQSTETFGVVPRLTPAPGRVPFPPDQVHRNLAATYESALSLLALLARGTVQDQENARLIADTFVYALGHDNHGDPLPVCPPNITGLHNGYSCGDIALVNPQAIAKKGDVRMAGFTCAGTSPTGYCLLLDGATGGNDSFAILALVAAYRKFKNPSYLEAARNIAGWIYCNLHDDSSEGFGGYFLGYADDGQSPKKVVPSKSTENNADIFSAYTALAAVEKESGNSAAAAEWTRRANEAAEFVLKTFDPGGGRFYAGTVPKGTLPGAGVQPSTLQQGNDVINTFDFLDANSFSVLALAGRPDYQNRIDWGRPVQFILHNFAQVVTAAGQPFAGFDLVRNPTEGPNGVTWEFTGQAVEAMRFVDSLKRSTTFAAEADRYLGQIRQAQMAAPFGDGKGLVASTVESGDRLPPIEQCLSTPFQCIPERVGLAATTWAILAEQNVNPLSSSLP